MYFCEGPPHIHRKDNDFSINPFILASPSKQYLLEVKPLSLNIWSTGKNRLLKGKISRNLINKLQRRPSASNNLKCFACWKYDSKYLAICNKDTFTIEIYKAKETLESVDLIDNMVLPEWIEAASETCHTNPEKKTVITFIQHINLSEQTDISSDQNRIIYINSDGNFLFIGLYSGMVLSYDWNTLEFSYTIQVIPFIEKNITHLFKEDELKYLESIDFKLNTNIKYLTCSSLDPKSSLLFLSFENGLCLLLHTNYNIPSDTIKKLFLFPIYSNNNKIINMIDTDNPNKNEINKINKKVTCASFDHESNSLVLGDTTANITIWSIKKIKNENIIHDPDTLSNLDSSIIILDIEFLREINMNYWGYNSNHLGGVNCLSLTPDSQVVAVGYEKKGLTVFSITGCRLMTTLSEQVYHPNPLKINRKNTILSTGVHHLNWLLDGFILVVTPYYHIDDHVNKIDESKIIRNDEKTNINDNMEKYYKKINWCLNYNATEGLGLCLSGDPTRSICWIAQEQSFVTNEKKKMAAESSKLLQAGDYLVSVNDINILSKKNLSNVYDIFQNQPSNQKMSLLFLRLNYNELFVIISKVMEKYFLLFPLPHIHEDLMSPRRLRKHSSLPLDGNNPKVLNHYNSLYFLHDLFVPLTEEKILREYAFRQQSLYGDCHQQKDTETKEHLRPGLFDFENRAKYDAWENLDGCPMDVAKQKYLGIILFFFEYVNNTKSSNNNNNNLPIINTLEDAIEILLQIAVDLCIIDNNNNKEIIETKTETEIEKNQSTNHIDIIGFEKNIRFIDFYFVKKFLHNNINYINENKYELTNFLFKDICFIGMNGIYYFTNLNNNKIVDNKDNILTENKKIILQINTITYPILYNIINYPIRIFETTNDGKQFAIAGKHGFALYNSNISGKKWRLFGNEIYEKETPCDGLIWLDNDIIIIITHPYSNNDLINEKYKNNTINTQSLIAFPRNYLDETAVLFQITLPNQSNFYNMIITKQDNNDTNDMKIFRLFCVSNEGLALYIITKKGLLIDETLILDIYFEKFILFNISPHNENNQLNSIYGKIKQIFPIERLKRVNHNVLLSKVEIEQEKVRRLQKDSISTSNASSNWFLSSVWSDNTKTILINNINKWILPRFLILDSIGNVHIWDPESFIHNVIATNISNIITINSILTIEWPKPLQSIYGLYGTDGFILWFPLLDGIIPMICSSFIKSDNINNNTSVDIQINYQKLIYNFFINQDPSRLSNYDKTNRSIHNTDNHVEKAFNENEFFSNYSLQDILSDYKLDLNNLDNSTEMNTYLNKIKDLNSSLQLDCSKDPLLEYDYEILPIGIHPLSGLLIGTTQDSYIPTFTDIINENNNNNNNNTNDLSNYNIINVPCYDLKHSFQPILYNILRFLLHLNRIQWLKEIVHNIFKNYKLNNINKIGIWGHMNQNIELFLFTIIEDIYYKRLPILQLKKVLDMIQYSNRLENDLNNDTNYYTKHYLEIISNTGRKIEPSRFNILFPLAGLPIDLFYYCIQNNYLIIASNFLLLLYKTSEENDTSHNILIKSNDISILKNKNDKINEKELNKKINQSQEIILKLEKLCKACIDLIVSAIKDNNITLAKNVLKIGKEWENQLSMYTLSENIKLSNDLLNNKNNNKIEIIEDAISKYMLEYLYELKFDLIILLNKELFILLPKLTKITKVIDKNNNNNENKINQYIKLLSEKYNLTNMNSILIELKNKFVFDPNTPKSKQSIKTKQKLIELYHLVANATYEDWTKAIEVILQDIEELENT